VTQRQYETDDFEGQDGKYDLTGTLSDDDGNPISDADLSVKSEDDGSEYSVKTDSDGKFALENVPAGKYTVTLDLDDYDQITEEHVVGDDDSTDGDDDSSNKAQTEDEGDSGQDQASASDTETGTEDQNGPDSDDSATSGTASAKDDDVTTGDSS
jgi:hypothetical protein